MNWTTRGFANSRLANSRTGQDAGWTTPGVRSVAQAACTPPVPAPAWHGARGRRMQYWTHRPHRCKYECYKL